MVCFGETRCIFKPISQTYRGKLMCTKSHGKSEVELSYQCKIHNLVTCEFMSLDMLIKTQTISPSIRDFVLKKDRDRCPLNTFTNFKMPFKRARVVCPWIVHFISHISSFAFVWSIVAFINYPSWILIFSKWHLTQWGHVKQEPWLGNKCQCGEEPAECLITTNEVCC